MFVQKALHYSILPLLLAILTQAQAGADQGGPDNVPVFPLCDDYQGQIGNDVLALTANFGVFWTDGNQDGTTAFRDKDTSMLILTTGKESLPVSVVTYTVTTAKRQGKDIKKTSTDYRFRIEKDDKCEVPIPMPDPSATFAVTVTTPA